MLLWPGREGLDEFSARMDSRCRSGRGLAHMPGMVVKGRGGEDLYSMKKFREIQPYMLDEEWRKLMPVENEMIAEQTAEVGKVLERYQEVVKNFRATVKNDIAAVKASAVATEETVNRIGKVYRDTAAMLTTPEFKLAIENAERMAAALKSITELQSHSITFAVLDKKTAT